MPEFPLVSMITPTLNAAKYVEECIQSVLQQSYPRIEHVFVDGGSTDETIPKLRRFEAEWPERIRVIVEPGSGVGEAWNIGLKLAKGDIFGTLGADDLCEPGAIEVVVEFFTSHPDARFLHGGCYQIDECGAIIGRHRARPFRVSEFVNTALQIASISAFYTRDVMESVNWLDSSGDDFDLLARIIHRFEVYPVERVLSRLRLRAGSAFNQSDFGKRKACYRQTYLVSRRYGGRILSPLAVRYFATVVIGWLQLHDSLPIIRRWYRVIRGRPGV